MSDFRLHRNAFGRLVLTTADGQSHTGVHVVRAFPLGAPTEGIALVAADGHELAWIERLDELPAPLQEQIGTELARREFTPVIVRLITVSTFATPSRWRVQTDRGETCFILRGEEDIRRLGQGRLLIGDSHGLHYLVPDLHALDAHSRRLLDRFL